MKRSKKRTRIVNKKRFGLFVTCTVLTVVMFGVFCSASASKDSETYVLTVSYGDTLWDIASEINTRNKDIRKVVDDIIRLNRLTDTVLCCGDELVIPVY